LQGIFWIFRDCGLLDWMKKYDSSHLKQVCAPTVPSAVIWKTCGVTNVLLWGNSSSKAKKCQKVVKKYGQKIVKKLQKVVKKLSKRCQKVVKKLQKVVKKLSKSCQKVQNSTNSGGGRGCVGGGIVVPRPLASASLTGRRQKLLICWIGA
jgi:hypothetical protein